MGRELIRPAESDDLDPVEAIEREVFPTDRASRRTLRHALRSPTIAFLVAADPLGAVLGYVLVEFRRRFHVARLASIAVAPAASGRGVGQRLLAEALDEARRRGCARLRLEVREDNRAALALYARAGFEPLAKLDQYYEDGSSARRFEKRIADLG